LEKPSVDGRIILKQVFTNRMGERGLHSSDSEYRAVTGINVYD